ncbi:hypothetical protein FOXG_04619 [Fusarium oxysporum f. sp. lycopersici 4287]|uniref:Ecp2 effector protein domain-containing protein n=2 Tax=Fusarium oxysporum TaxID=5507 RepID=A0A0J9USV8_FUSO4|nr:hypothetical protein FOXG_04619 [Fusarium oxysporum f. sp. lycopersici 4287]EXK43542.1 hypothetical protein FOMG_02487 [Fusarium oxysporum f. sp. melonis 26406]KAJ9427776.1 hypothetical protein QL093DRAFT_1214734 [Fusarium oxysporum]KNB01351.1 hypothetical protein FOXG_04619 [Fusarium oxysporum f. sp. lycopersici 4287]
MCFFNSQASQQPLALSAFINLPYQNIMHLPSVLTLIAGLPAAMAAAISKPEHESEGIFKRGDYCYNTGSNNSGWRSIPSQDIQGLIDQLYKIGDNTFLLHFQTSGQQWQFEYRWGQAKICVANEYWAAQNTHLKMSEAAWVVSYIRDKCSSHIGDAICHGDTGLNLQAMLRHVNDPCEHA